MNKNLVEVGFVIDASGSMTTLKNDTIGGFNSVIESQKAQDGETRVSAVTFNDSVNVLYDNVDVKEITPLNTDTYHTWGCTALYDALGKLIDSIGERLAATPEDERPGKVLIVVITDGEENSSMRYTFGDIKERVERQQNVYSWEFMFLGADMNSMRQARAMGFKNEYSKVYSQSSRGVSSVYTAVDSMVSTSKSVAKGDIDEQTYLRSMACSMDSVVDSDDTALSSKVADTTLRGTFTCTTPTL